MGSNWPRHVLLEGPASTGKSLQSIRLARLYARWNAARDPVRTWAVRYAARVNQR